MCLSTLLLEVGTLKINPYYVALSSALSKVCTFDQVKNIWIDTSVRASVYAGGRKLAKRPPCIMA